MGNSEFKSVQDFQHFCSQDILKCSPKTSNATVTSVQSEKTFASHLNQLDEIIERNETDEELELPFGLVSRNMVGSPRTKKVQARLAFL